MWTDQVQFRQRLLFFSYAQEAVLGTSEFVKVRLVKRSIKKFNSKEATGDECRDYQDLQACNIQRSVRSALISALS